MATPTRWVRDFGRFVKPDANPIVILQPMASLHWLSQGWGYEITGFDVLSAFDFALKAAEELGLEAQVRKDIRKIIDQDRSPGMFVKDVLGRHFK